LLIVARSTPVGDPSSPEDIFKLQAELKPFALSNTNTPLEMRNWIVWFRRDEGRDHSGAGVCMRQLWTRPQPLNLPVSQSKVFPVQKGGPHL
jgi:hypothetical protein